MFLNIFSENRKKLKQQPDSISVSVLQSSLSSQSSTLKSSSKNSFAGFNFEDQSSSSSKNSFGGFSFSDQASSSSSVQSVSSIFSSSISSGASASSSAPSSSSSVASSSSTSSSLASSVSSSISSAIASSSSSSSVSSSVTSVASSSSSVITNVYRNGTYSSSVSYSVPGGTNQLTVNITILNDTVTLVTNQHSPQSSASTSYINSFEGGVQGEVVGKKLDQINLSKVSAASLTPIGFNNAINQIKTLAAI